MLNPRNIILILVVLAIIGSIFFLEKLKPQKNGTASNFNPVAQIKQGVDNATHPKYIEIADPTGFVNTDPFKLADLVGQKVILVDFWTYSCINCQRTFPFLTAWYEKYKDQGFEIVGVHTPEFEFEKDINNVKAATIKYGIKYPVVLDSNYGTWNAYNNHYWPAHYLIDINGNIISYHFGEGAYDETEKQIQQALKERMGKLGVAGNVDSSISQPKDTFNMDFSQVQSPETYFGTKRNSNFGNGTSGIGGTYGFTVPEQINSNNFYLGGKWSLEPEFATNTDAGAKIVFKYSAKSVYFVAGADSPVKIKVLRDGQPLGNAKDQDVDNNSEVTVKDERLYRLIDDPQGYGQHTLEIQIQNPDLKAFTFTFG
jgi:thiol-disulfide isomerase/thioredoxin